MERSLTQVDMDLDELYPEKPTMVEVCGCGVDKADAVDWDGDGIGEGCRACGEFIGLQGYDPRRHGVL